MTTNRKNREYPWTVSIILVITMLLTLTAGCANVTPTPASSPTPTVPVADYGDTGGIALPISQEVITVRALMNMEMDTPLTDTFFIKEVEKRTNIKLTFENLNPGDWNEKKTILIAANNLPDLVGGQWTAAIDALGMDAFVPLSDNLDKLPNFKKILDEKPAILNALAQSDKKLYLFPHLSYKYAPEVNWGFIYRKDIFDKNNIPAPKGPDSYYSALKKLKEIYPDSIPFINYYESDMSLFAQGWGVNSGFCLPDGSDKMVFGPATAEWKDFLAYFHKLYAEGLMDPEFFTSGEEAFSANVLQESKSFVFRGWFGRLDTLENAIKDKIPGYDLEAAFPFGPKTTIFREAQFLDYGTSVSASSKYISEVLQLFDYFLSPSGMELCSMGQKGVTYNVDGSGQIKYVGLEDKNPTMNELAKSFGIGINGILYASDPRSVNWLLSPNRQRAFDLLKDAGFTKEPQPMLSFTKAESEELTPINDALNKDYIEWQVNFIMGKVSINENWDAYIKVLEADGLKRAEEIYNAAYQRYIG